MQQNMLYAMPLSSQSASIYMNQAYFVMQGPHYNFRDWYLQKTVLDASVPVMQIQSMEYIKMRSKWWLMFFASMTFLFLSFAKKIYRSSEVAFVICLFLCFAFLVVYVCSAKRLFRITAPGCMLAVETKYYRQEELEYMMNCWNYMRYGRQYNL